MGTLSQRHIRGNGWLTLVCCMVRIIGVGDIAIRQTADCLKLAGGQDSGRFGALLQPAGGRPQRFRHCQNGGQHSGLAAVMPLPLHHSLLLPGCWAHRQQSH